MKGNFVINTNNRQIEIEQQMFYLYSNLPHNLAVFRTDFVKDDVYNEHHCTLAVVDRDDGEVMMLYKASGKDLTTTIHATPFI